MGVTKELIAEGHGATPAVGSTVTVQCTGYGKDRDLGVKFWRSRASLELRYEGVKAH